MMLRSPRAQGQPPLAVDARRRKLLNQEVKTMNNSDALAAEDQILFHEKDEPGETRARTRRTLTIGPTSTLAEWSDSSERVE